MLQGYPIGSLARGLCKLQVEETKHGYRTVRTTTNKKGVWCKPKKSTYRSYTCVCRRLGDAMWLCFSATGVGVNAANGETATLAIAPASTDHSPSPRPRI